MSILGFSDEPDFVNDEGTKWWIDVSTTQYAQREDAHGTVLDMVVYLAETKNGYMTRVLLDDDRNIVEEEQNLEALAIKIDMLKANERFE